LRRLAIGLLATLAGITMIGSAASAQDSDSDTGSTEPATKIEGGSAAPAKAANANTATAADDKPL